jgi:uncharacterized membrane protein YphA (DoxX/SURF4 family)
MLNTFPELLSYSPLAPFILRGIVGLILLDMGLLKYKKERHRWIASLQALHVQPASMWVSLTGAIEVVSGLMLLAGIYTQLASLTVIILTGLELFVEWKDETILKRGFVFYLLILVIAVSLLFTGAGAFAFDIPL